MLFGLVLAAMGSLGFKAGEATLILLTTGSQPFDVFKLLADGGLVAALVVAVWWFVKDRKDLTKRLDKAHAEVVAAKDEEIARLRQTVQDLNAELKNAYKSKP